MPTDPALPSVERIRYAVYNGPHHMSDWATREEADKSVAALAYLNLPLEVVTLGDARLVPALMAEVEAWRRKAGVQYGGKWHVWNEQELQNNPLPEADATDAALARAGVKMGGPR